MPWWRSVFTLMLGSGLAQLGPLLLAPFLARVYSPEAFGWFHVASAVAANVAVVACGRYEFALPLAAHEGEAQALRRLCLRLLAAVTGLTGLVSALWWVHSGAQPGAQWLWMLAPMVAALGLLSVFTLQAMRDQRFHALAWARVLQWWGGGGLQLALSGLNAGVWGLLWGPLLAALLAAAVLARRGPAATGPERVPGLLEVARRHRHFPVWNTPHAFMGALQDTASLALLAAVLNPAAAGVWGLCLRLLKAPATLAGGAVSQVLYPRLARLGPQGRVTQEARREVRRLMALLALAALPLTLAVAAAGPWALALLLGPGWDAAGPVAQALALYVGLHFVASPLGVVTLAWNAQPWALRNALWGQALHVAALAAGLGLGPLVGLEPLTAAAHALSAAMALYFGLYFWRLARWPVEATPQATMAA